MTDKADLMTLTQKHFLVYFLKWNSDLTATATVLLLFMSLSG